MTAEDIEQNRALYIEVIKETIKATVNGKIDKMDKKLDEHYIVDQETSRILTEYIKKDEAWKGIADPYIKLAANISGVWRFLVYCCG